MKTSARMKLGMLMALASVSASCWLLGKPEPPWDVEAISERLHRAGYVVVPADDPGLSAPSVRKVRCFDARKGGASDMLCVVFCEHLRTCRGMTEMWESYGVFQRGDSFLIHQRCAFPRDGGNSDCAAVRDSLGL